MATKKPDGRTGVFLAHLAVIAVMVVVLATAYVTYVDTKWMHTEIKAEAKNIRKLEERIAQMLVQLKEEKDARNHRLNPSPADGL